MSNRDPKCVFVGNSLGEADIVAAWLSGHGYLAKVMGVAALEGALRWIPFNEFGSKGVEVWLLDETHAAEARQLLSQRSEELKSRLGRVSLEGSPIKVVCEKCGHSNTFASADRGTVQSCRRCDEYLDVGDSDDIESPAGSITDRVHKVMELANQEALRFNHQHIDTEHILLGMIEEGSGVAANVLTNLGVDRRKIRIAVEAIVDTRLDYVPISKLPPTPRARKVIEYAMEEAHRLNHNYFGSEHILLGLLCENEGIAAQVLLNLGLTLERAREEVIHLLGDWTNALEAGGLPLTSSPNAGLARRLGQWLHGWFIRPRPSE